MSIQVVVGGVMQAKMADAGMCVCVGGGCWPPKQKGIGDLEARKELVGDGTSQAPRARGHYAGKGSDMVFHPVQRRKEREGPRLALLYSFEQDEGP